MWRRLQGQLRREDAYGSDLGATSSSTALHLNIASFILRSVHDNSATSMTGSLRMSDINVRPATLADVPTLDRWDLEPHVIAATSDDPNAAKAFDDAYWPDELAMQSDVSRYYIAEMDGRPIGALQIIDPHREPTHYWGEIEPNLRAIG